MTVNIITLTIIMYLGNNSSSMDNEARKLIHLHISYMTI